MNKIKIGDRVQLTAKCHTWHTEHLVETHTFDGKIGKNLYEDAALLLGSKARRTKLKGTALNYGAEDNDFKDKRKFVNVEFQWKNLKTNFYCSEKDLKKL